VVLFGCLWRFDGVWVCWYGVIWVVFALFGVKSGGLKMGQKWGFRGGGRGVLRKWGFFEFPGV